MLLPVLPHLGPQCWLGASYALLSLLCWSMRLICEGPSPLIAAWIDFVRLAPLLARACVVFTRNLVFDVPWFILGVGHHPCFLFRVRVCS